ncbi:Asp23/Gls24 family envelope stress response protein [Corynebacteriaceae bacterium 7-707]
MPDVPAESSGGDAVAVELPRSRDYLRQRTHTTIETRVLEKIGVHAALSVPGVIRHSSGIGQITGRRLPRVAVQMDPAGTAAVVDVQVATSWPAPTVAVAQVTREAVGEWIEHTTGVPVLAVNVEVAAVVPAPGPAVTVRDLSEAPRTPELTTVSATPLQAESPTVSRGVPTVTVPDAPAPVPLLHPQPVENVRLTPVSAGRPQPARRVAAPPRRPVRRPVAPAPVRATPVPAPPAPTVTRPATPRATPVLRPRPPYGPSRPRPLEPVIVDRVEVTAPPRPHGLRILYDVPTPAGPRMRDIPTPRGLPTRTVPTPQGLGVSVHPTVRRHRRIPVTVDTGRRWGGGPSDTSDASDASDADRSTR